MNLSIITPTKNRAAELRRMLQSLAAQSISPQAVIVVDASPEPRSPAPEFPTLNILFHPFTGTSSAAAQRNAGISLLAPNTDWALFFDDDQTLHPSALSHLHKCLEALSPEVGGVALFSSDYLQPRPFGLLRKIAASFGLYPAAPGAVAPSGWQSTLCGVTQNIQIQWASSAALAVRAQCLETCRFDEFFTQYSYLEDVDFSFTLGQSHRLQVCCEASFDHHHSPSARQSRYDFGKMEVRNRRYFVKKHHLSMPRFRIAMFARFLVSLGTAQFARAAGNIAAVWGRRIKTQYPTLNTQQPNKTQCTC